MIDVSEDQLNSKATFWWATFCPPATGARWRPGWVQWGDADNVLPNGRGFDREELSRVAARILGRRKLAT